MKSIACVFLVSVTLVAGCAPPPVRQNAWTSNIMSQAVSPYAGATVAVVYSDNTKNALEYLRKSTYGQYDPDAVFALVFGAFDKDFKRAVRVSRLEEGKGVGADVVMVVDFYAALSTNKFSPTKMDATVAALTLDGRQIDRFAVHAESRQSWTAASRPYGAAVEQGAKDLGAQLEEKMLASSKLQDFVGSGQEGTLARPASAAASSRPAPAAPAEPKVIVPSFRNEANDDYAVIIGIEHYPDLPAAAYAERDAVAAKSFIRALGVPERNIVLLTGGRATKTGMEKTIEAWLPNNVSEKSRVYVYYSGHGAPDTKTGEAYLMPSDGDPQYLAQTGYPLKRLYSKLGELKTKSVLVALDSCFSGAGGRSVLAKGTRPLVGKVDMEVQTQGKVSVIAASAGDQISGVNDDAGYGLFTYNFLQGLNGAAKDAQGRVTLQSLYGYLKPRVQDDARRSNRDQTPQLQAAGEDILLRAR
ncbi:MAG: caspase family protein [Elusimicrobia bacterium]|nr:caspase family protein [Elusimicrobiota bacterium]